MRNAVRSKNYSDSEMIIDGYSHACEKFLTPEKIKDIEIITVDYNEMAIFGSIAGFGVIIFDLNKKKLL